MVLSGGYQEAGLAGRYDLKAGDVVIHRAFDTHLDHVWSQGARVLNLPLPIKRRLPPVFRINDPDMIARTAERDPYEAAQAIQSCGPVKAADDWPDLLASEMASGPKHLGRWAATHGFAAETLSRGFRRAYGVTPARFRAELNAHRALKLVDEGDEPLAAIAASCGFADQAHLTRAIVQLTGAPPGYRRRKSIPFKIEAGLAD